MKYAYFPGCSQESTAQEYDQSLRAVAARLETMTLVEMADWNCCGATPAATIDPDLPYALAARNLAIAEDMGLQMVAPCAACYKNMRKAGKALAHDEALRSRINQALDKHYLGQPPAVRHPLDVVVNDVGLDNLPVEKPLRGLKVASYYGCLITRPEGGFDDPERPETMDRLMETLGAEAVAWPYKTRCCGGAIYMTTEEISLRLSAEVLSYAHAAGANAVSVGCPFCQLLLDMYQDRLEALKGRSFRLPVFFFSQLMGLAMNLDRAELGLQKLVVPPYPLLAETIDSGQAQEPAPARGPAARPVRWGQAKE